MTTDTSSSNPSSCLVNNNGEHNQFSRPKLSAKRLKIDKTYKVNINKATKRTNPNKYQSKNVSFSLPKCVMNELTSKYADVVKEVSELKSKIKLMEDMFGKLAYLTVITDPTSTIRQEDLKYTDMLINTISNEVKMRIERAKNIVLFNIPDKYSTDEIKSRLISTTHLSNTNLICHRLKRRSFRFPCPVLLKLPCIDDAICLYKQQANIKANTPFKNLIIKFDKTRIQRLATVTTKQPEKNDKVKFNSKNSNHCVDLDDKEISSPHPTVVLDRSNIIEDLVKKHQTSTDLVPDIVMENIQGKPKQTPKLLKSGDQNVGSLIHRTNNDKSKPNNHHMTIRKSEQTCLILHNVAENIPIFTIKKNLLKLIGDTKCKLDCTRIQNRSNDNPKLVQLVVSPPVVAQIMCSQSHKLNMMSHFEKAYILPKFHPFPYVGNRSPTISHHSPYTNLPSYIVEPSYSHGLTHYNHRQVPLTNIPSSFIHNNSYMDSSSQNFSKQPFSPPCTHSNSNINTLSQNF